MISITVSRQPGQSLGLSAPWGRPDYEPEASRFRMALQAIRHMPESMEGAQRARAIARTALEDSDA